MKPVSLAKERRMSEKRRLKRLAAEAKHTHPDVMPTRYIGRRLDKWDDFVPPEDLNASQRRVR